MKRARTLIISLLVCALTASSCGSNSSQTSGADSGAKTTDDATASNDDQTNNIEVDEGLLSTEIRLPLDLFTAGTEGNVTPPTEAELQASLDAEGYDIDATINSDNTVTYRMSRREYDRFKKDLKEGVDKSIQEAINNESNIYKSITYSDDLRQFKVTVNRTELENSFSFFAFSIVISAGFYQAFTGVSENDRYVIIDYVDERTNAIFDTYDSREDES